MGTLGTVIDTVFNLKFDFKSLFDMIRTLDFVGILMMFISSAV